MSLSTNTLLRETRLVARARYQGADVVLKATLGEGVDAVLASTPHRVEALCLRILRGLAVPEPIELDRKELTSHLPANALAVTVTRWLPGAKRRTYTSRQALGLWIFAIEQLCAFRRLKILNVDIKHDDLLVAEDLSWARFVDFNACIPVNRSGRYRNAFPATRAYLAPEVLMQTYVDERAFVYLAGMLFGRLLHPGFANTARSSGVFQVVARRLERDGLGPVGSLLFRTVALDPSARPRTLETLWVELSRLTCPSQSTALWRRLRRPYGERLQRLGF
jgi:serine/threonine protein kinase